MKPTGPDNPNLKQLISDLRHLSTQQKVNVWKSVAAYLGKPTRSRSEVSLSTLSSVVRDGEVAVVPGKVLANGDFEKKVTVAAWNFSSKAKLKINKSGKAISIEELIKQNPKGSKVRIIA